MRAILFGLLLLPVVAMGKTDLLDLSVTPENLMQFVATEPVCLLDGYVYWQGDIAYTALGEYWRCEVTETGFRWRVVTQSN
ncbi:hypothetical protein [Salinibius halmophilus]|uniref:hypothetical protein n=1 Tax=Salinibius halmophilus TaxID=1853216 RepID=UPI000E670365|nr:hypothetical protein [Salinibius halmophilus]